MKRGGLSPRTALVVLAGVWTFGIVFLVGSLFGSVGVDHLRDAPTCSPSQTFTSVFHCSAGLCAAQTPDEAPSAGSDAHRPDLGQRRPEMITG